MYPNERRDMERKIQIKGGLTIKQCIFSQEDISFIINAYCNLHWGTPAIAEYFRVSPTTINKLLRAHQVAIRDNKEKGQKYTCNEHYFDNIDSEHQAYWLGFLYADGYVSPGSSNKSSGVGVAINTNDRELLEQFKEDIGYTGPIHRYEQKTAYGMTSYCRIFILSDMLYNGLRSKGVVPRKSLILNFPSKKVVPVGLISHFIRGYLDGDGSITRHTSKENMELSIKFCGTKQMLEGIKKVFQVEHLKLEETHSSKNKNNFQLTIGGNRQVYNILKKIYTDATVFLKRKFEKAQILFNMKEGIYE